MLFLVCFYLELLHGVTALASKKGIVITAIIAAGIIGTSVLIWLLPQQGTPTGVNITDEKGAEADAANLPADNLSFVYTQHNFATTEVENSFDKWSKGEVAANDMNAAISTARSNLDALKKRVDTPGVPQQWQESYGLYSQALGKFGSYLDEMKRLVDSNDKNAADHATLDSIKTEMNDLVDRSIKAFPTTAAPAT
ncbi:hypothetical protein NTE_00629 [Candidatus Nitrososphaera evergladensis SR1]|uniref:Uncharacterized protein n=1 Tax=Candidatus Nitrososphaera evergladensis SR1 TaxID=1459636 RepID=A0A075MTW1_9ARCH|nr:hypothetical protein NTE_00629 [Candidatus Nitrososphaera evergladensis SR1]